MAGTGLACAGRPTWAKGAEAHVEVFADDPLARIAPEIHDHFTEHIGGVIYDGVWAGEASKIQNRHGLRQKLIDRISQFKFLSFARPADALLTATTGETE